MDRVARARQARDALRTAWRDAGWYPDLTVAEAIAAGAGAHPDAQLVFAPTDGEPTTVTLAELHRRASDVAGGLDRLGVHSGDAVVIRAPATADSTAFAMAVWMLGAVPVPIVVTATPADIDHVVTETAADVMVTATRWRDDELLPPPSGIRRVVTIGDDLPRAPLPAIARPSPSDVACILYTSGSTAAPKGVQHSHETLLFGLTLVPADATTRTLASFPAGHVASLLGLLRPLTVGGTTVVMDRWSARAAAALIEQYRLTTSAGTPFFLATLLDVAEASGRDICSLDKFLVGAAAVPPALVARAETAGITTWRTYGSTEHPAISSGGPTDPPDKRRHTDGRVTPGNEVRLVDEAGHDVEPGAEGEIVARGPKQFLGYRNAALDADAFVDETWFRTGDLGHFDDDGYLVITDRAKDVIIRGGENISSREVEETLAGAPGVADIAVCAAPDDVWGEVVCAVVVPSANPPTLATLREHCRSRGLAPHKFPTSMVVIDKLPRTPAGKVRKRDLRPLLANDHR
jgi:acyl-CoA synthetase (AMP-forming)/AMP-acid ligase II